MKFEWDLKKAHTNTKKHGVNFDEAKTVFNDTLAYIFDDEWNSLEEKRELIIGHSTNQRFLMVSFIERSPGVIRIISARQTTAKERKDYEEQRTY